MPSLAEKPERSPVHLDLIPPEMKAVDQWLGWKWTKNEKGRYDKPPYSIRTGKQHSKTDRTMYVSFQQAAGAVKRFDGLGFAFTDEDDFAFIDLDKCINTRNMEISADARFVVELTSSYTEVSPSGTGLKIYIIAKPPDDHKCQDESKGFEFYHRGAYSCVTGNHFADSPTTIRTLSGGDVQRILDFMFPPPMSDCKPPKGFDIDEEELACQAMFAISPKYAEGYHDWVRVGMAAHATSTSQQMLNAWETWSQSSDKYTPGECQRKWKSFGTGSRAVTIGTLIHLARENGFVVPWKSNGHAHSTNNGATKHVDAVCVRADTIKPRKIRWFWHNRFARGKYNEAIGQPGLGKSLLLIDLTARETRGLPFPDETSAHEPGDVVLLSAEDDPEDTTVPRLIAAGADLTKVHILTAVSAPDKNGIRPISLDTDIPAVERLLETLPNATLLVIDPIGAYGGKTDSHKGAEVRAFLLPLTMMAQRRDIAIVGITHFNKGGNGPAVTRGLGSIAWTAAARMSWGVVRDPEDPTCRLFLPIKCNLAADVGGLSYRIIDVDGVPQIAWSNDAVTRTVDDVLAEQQGGSRSPKAKEATDWLRRMLANGRVPAQEIKEQAKSAGHSERALNTAKTTLRITPYAEGFGKDCVWYWSLPDSRE